MKAEKKSEEEEEDEEVERTQETISAFPQSSTHQLRHILLVLLLLELATRPVQAQSKDGFIFSHPLFCKGNNAAIPR